MIKNPCSSIRAAISDCFEKKRFVAPNGCECNECLFFYCASCLNLFHLKDGVVVRDPWQINEFPGELICYNCKSKWSREHPMMRSKDMVDHLINYDNQTHS